MRALSEISTPRPHPHPFKVLLGGILSFFNLFNFDKVYLGAALQKSRPPEWPFFWPLATPETNFFFQSALYIGTQEWGGW